MSRKLILDRLNDIVFATDSSNDSKLIQLIDQASRVFVTGAGRSGMVSQFFAMRLMHANVSVHLLGNTLTPSIKKGDLLILLSGSGETETMISLAKRAKKLGVGIIVISSKTRSSLGFSRLSLPDRA